MNQFNDIGALQLQLPICFDVNVNLNPEAFILHNNSQFDFPVAENCYRSDVQSIDENSVFENPPVSSFILITPNGENSNNMHQIPQSNFSLPNIGVTANLPSVEMSLFNAEICQESPSYNYVSDHCEENTNVYKTSSQEFSNGVETNLPSVELSLFSAEICQEPFQESPSYNHVSDHCDENPIIYEPSSQEFSNGVVANFPSVELSLVNAEICQEPFQESPAYIHVSDHCEENLNVYEPSCQEFSNGVATNFPSVELSLFSAEICQEPFQESPSYNHVSDDCEENPNVYESSSQEFSNGVAANLPSVELSLVNAEICQEPFQESPAYNHVSDHCEENPNVNEPSSHEFSSQAAFDELEQMHADETILDCDLCQKAFSRADELYKHMSTHVYNSKTGISQFPKDIFTCEKCLKKYSDKKTFASHMYTHTGLKPYMCAFCQKTFLSMQGLNHHIKTHAKYSYICKECSREFSNQVSFDKHVQMHADKTPLNCDVCDASFDRVDEFVKHRYTHVKNNPERVIRHRFRKQIFACEKCSEKFSCKTTFLSHMYDHTGQKQYMCELCQKTFKTHTGLIYHNKIRANNPHMCKSCCQQFSDQAAFDKHMQMYAAESHTNQKAEIAQELKKTVKMRTKKPYMCKPCSEEFCDQAAFLKHMQIHAGGTTDCDVCHASPNQADEFVSHMSTHLKPVKHQLSKTLTCKQCLKKFSNKTELLNHKCIHIGQKLFICELCQKSFISIRNFNNHRIKTHNSDLLYACEECKKTFKERKQLITHSKKFHPKVYSCETCKKTLRTKYTFDHHLRLHTNKTIVRYLSKRVCK